MFPSPNAERIPTVLVIDDDPAALALIEVILRRHHLATLTATSAEIGMQMIQTRQPDVLILDDVMPSQNGGELCRRLKRDKLYSHIPVIILSAGMRVRDPAYRQYTGADAALLKPFLPGELLQTIQHVLSFPIVGG